MKRSTGGALTRAVKTLAVTLVASAAWTATAAAGTTLTVGPPDISQNTFYTLSEFTTVNKTLADGTAVKVTKDGTVTRWRAHFSCDGACGTAQFVVLRDVGNQVLEIVEASAVETPDGSGVKEYVTSLPVLAGDLIGVQGTASIKVQNVDGDAEYAYQTANGGFIQVHAWTPDFIALFNADVLSLSPTATEVTATPSPVVVGEKVEAAVQVTATAPNDVSPATPPSLTGTVSLTLNGMPIQACQSLPLDGGAATCDFPAPPYPGPRTIEATYAGDQNYAGSVGDTPLRIQAKTAVTATAPSPVARGAAVKYKAEVSGLIPAGVSVQEAAASVAFFVDGEPVADCGTRPVDSEGLATCSTTAPPTARTYTLTAKYSGNQYTAASVGTTPFNVVAPAVSVPEALDFASVTLGSATAKTVTLTNSGGATLHVGGVKLEGSFAFAIVADGCHEASLKPGKSCYVELSFHPGTVGAFTGKLVISDDADGGPHSVALTGIGEAVPAPPEPPKPPAPTPTPVPPVQPGAKLAPGAKPTLTVEAPSTSGSSASADAPPKLELPLSCPATETCLLDGTMTVATSKKAKASASAAAAATTTVARFSKIKIEAGKVKTIKLELSRSFVKAAHKQGIRRIRATLTINTVLGSGERITTQQRVTVLLPKAAKKKKAAQKLRPRFTG